LLRDELQRAMALSGCAAMSDIGPHLLHGCAAAHTRATKSTERH
jgi:hypothetical protein